MDSSRNDHRHSSNHLWLQSPVARTFTVRAPLYAKHHLNVAQAIKACATGDQKAGGLPSLPRASSEAHASQRLFIHWEVSLFITVLDARMQARVRTGGARNRRNRANSANMRDRPVSGYCVLRHARSRPRDCARYL